MEQQLALRIYNPRPVAVGNVQTLQQQKSNGYREMEKYVRGMWAFCC